MMNQVQFGAVYTVQGSRQEIKTLTNTLSKMAKNADMPIAFVSERYNDRFTNVKVVTAEDATEQVITLSKEWNLMNRELNSRFDGLSALRAKLKNLDIQEYYLNRRISYSDTQFDLRLSRKATKTAWVKNKISWLLKDMGLKETPALSQEIKARQLELRELIAQADAKQRSEYEALNALSANLEAPLKGKNLGTLDVAIVEDRIKLDSFNLETGNFDTEA